MGRSKKIHQRQVAKAQKLLSELPVKDDRCSREEAVGLLEKDLRKAFKRGYSPQDIYALFRKERIPIPTYLLSKYFDELPAEEENEAQAENGEGTKSVAFETPADRQEHSCKPEKFSVPAENKDHSKAMSGQNEDKATCNPQKPVVKYGTFEITPDIPRGEL